MTENLPAVQQQAPALTLVQQGRADLVDPATDSWTAVVRDVATFAKEICDTEFVPKGMQGRPDKATAAIMYGREIGLPPMNALATIHVINGKPGISAEVMRSMVLQAGHEFEVTEKSGARVTVRGRRRGSQNWLTISWTQEDAKQAGLLSNNTYKAYPRQMLMARATTELCRDLFPDVIHGLQSVEELESIAPEPEPAAAAAEPGPARRTIQRKRKPAQATQAAPAQQQPEAEQPALEAPARQTMPLPTPKGQQPPVVDAEPIELQPITEAQARQIVLQFERLGVNDRDVRLWMTDVLSAAWKDGQQLTSTNDLTYGQGKSVYDQLSGLRDATALESHLDSLESPDQEELA